MKLSTPIYITGAAQISIQKPLADEWLSNPQIYQPGEYAVALDPEFKQWISPVESRRLGKILRRAIAVSASAMEEACTGNPGAIITATGLGCMKNTELFLYDITYKGENLLKPTQFMQSTHNTIGSLVAIRNNCHSYNNTFANGDVSFESAMYDAAVQLESGQISDALVGAYDEMTPDYYKMLQKAGYYSTDMTSPSGETAVAIVLSHTPGNNTNSGITEIDTLYSRSGEFDSIELDIPTPDIILIGCNGSLDSQKRYSQFLDKRYPDIRTIEYKSIFGESPTSSAFGVYMANRLMATDHDLNNILCLNICKKDMAYISISRS